MPLSRGWSQARCREPAGFRQDSDLQGPSRKCLVSEAEITAAGGRWPSACLPAWGPWTAIPSTPALLKLLPAHLTDPSSCSPPCTVNAARYNRAAGKTEPLFPRQALQDGLGHQASQRTACGTAFLPVNPELEESQAVDVIIPL